MPLKRLDRVGTKMQSFQEERQWEDQVRKDAGDELMGEGYKHFQNKTETPEEVAARKEAERIKQRIRPDNQRYYIAAETFGGWKCDYVFTTRDRGTGYYWDGMDTYKEKVLGQDISAAQNTEKTEPGEKTEKLKKKKQKRTKKQKAAPAVLDDPMHPMEQVAAAIQRRKQALSQPPFSSSLSLRQHTLSSTSSVISGLAETTTDSSLPKGWEKAADPSSQRVYYFNRSTGERKWEYPCQASESQANSTDSTPNGQNSQDVNNTLPKVWKETVDAATGKKYFYNSETGQTSWKIPKEDVAIT
uniref:WW domain-containing protein n=1 Tax=Ditylum brightwellii TaxID=49249 RepID=A0A7S1Z6Q3_9STRA